MTMITARTSYKYLFLPTALILFSIFAGESDAEKIYCKNGKVINENIAYRNRGVVWYKQSTGMVGISAENIEKIENDNGSISKYDYNAIGHMVQKSVKEGKYTDAIALCTSLLEMIPEDIQIHYLRGILNQKTGNIENARLDYDFIVKRNKADAAILNNLGTIYANDNKYADAADLFIKAVAVNPDMVRIHDNLAVASLQANDYSRAMGEYEEVIKREPGNLNALYNLGVIYMSRGEYRKAKELWERALALSPADADTKKALEAFKAKDK